METYVFTKKCRFSKLHVFPYSSRSGTVAAKMKDQIDPKIKKERALRLRNLSTSLENEYIAKFVGQKIPFLIEQYDEKSKCYKGHSSNYLECSVKNDNFSINSIVEIEVNFDSVKIS